MKFFKTILLILIVAVTVQGCSKEKQAENDAKENVGDSAKDLLNDADFKSVLLEVQYIAGSRPTTGTIDNLTSFMEEHLNKPQGLEIQLREIPSQGKTSFSVNDIRAIEDNNRTVFNDGTRLGVYMLFINGNHNEDNDNGKVLGVAYRNTSTVIYEKTIKENAGGFGQPTLEKLETSVAWHELGHIMGLVNVGTPAQSNHQDVAHGHHCDVEDCLMYYAVETGAFIDNLVGSPIPTLDAQCKADLKANGGK
ncbi:MAG: hypothetical protein ACI81S_000781 [Sphingobacteriales bacterium]|jgi:hypothetical protein